jgi:hypothetical protein
MAIVYLMRGLPGSGKSRKAIELAGSDGAVFETDQYFYRSSVGSGVRGQYRYDSNQLKAAREWNLQRFRDAVVRGISPIVVDRGCGLNAETKAYASYAVENGYQVELAEPDSPWWQELRILLKYKDYLDGVVLDDWAKKLANITLAEHRVPSKTIREWMSHWRHDLTVEEILRLSVPLDNE